MSYHLALMEARAELLDMGMARMNDTLAYFRSAGIERTPEANFAIGAATVCSIADHGNRHFDFDATGVDALVCEALAEEGETCIDLVAWPLDRPGHVLTMFAKCGLLGAFDAFSASSYTMGCPLTIHRTPLDLFKSGFRGAAIVTPHVAARLLLDVPGQIAARDYRHGRELKALVESVIPRDRIVVPANKVRRAA